MAYLAQLVDDVVSVKFELDKAKIMIGRRPENDIQIDDVAVSGQHAIISLEKNDYLPGSINIMLEDLGSTNGSYVNGKAIKGKVQLADNDVIRIAWNEFKLMAASGDDLEKTALILGL